MFGRESLREFVRGESQSFREFLLKENQATRDLIERQHEEFLRIQKRREEESREFMHEILLRNEKVYTSVIAELQRMGRQIEENTAQIRANTQAVLSVLDRLQGSGGATA